MGDIVGLYCECGYSREPLYVGWGMKWKFGGGMEWEYGGRKLFQCRRCRHFLISRSRTKQKSCSKCGSRQLDEIDVTVERIKPLICPSCGEKRLHVGLCGVWD